MKNLKIYTQVFTIAVFIWGAVSCGKDNYAAPESSLSGHIIDAETNQPIPQQTVNGGILQLFQTDFNDNPVSINSVFHSDGSYANTLLFDGNYKAVITGPFFYDDTVHVEVRGNKQLDIKARAYLYVEAEVTEVTATTATVEVKVRRGPGNTSQKIARVACVIGTTNTVDINFFTKRELTNTEADEDATVEAETYTYTFTALTPGTTYYIRGTARTINTGNHYNYAPLIELKTLLNGS